MTPEEMNALHAEAIVANHLFNLRRYVYDGNAIPPDTEAFLDSGPFGVIRKLGETGLKIGLGPNNSGVLERYHALCLRATSRDLEGPESTRSIGHDVFGRSKVRLAPLSDSHNWH